MGECVKRCCQFQLDHLKAIWWMRSYADFPRSPPHQRAVHRSATARPIDSHAALLVRSRLHCYQCVTAFVSRVIIPGKGKMSAFAAPCALGTRQHTLLRSERTQCARPRARTSTGADASMSVDRRGFLSTSALGALGAAMGGVAAGDVSPALSNVVKPLAWEAVNLDSEATIFDVDFSPVEPTHGFLVGTRGMVSESTDGGFTWKARSFTRLDADEELNYRFEKITFRGDEGWVIGKPSLLLHTSDSGKSWERVPLSAKLPGEPASITALGKGKAEMTTSAGAVYVTENGGKNWKAQVRETIDATLNRTISSGVSGASYFTGSIISVLRDGAGDYLAVSSRGNFFLTWRPGQEFWVPHARDSSRRIQAMGFVRDDVKAGVWMSTRGGGLAFSDAKPDLESTATLPFKNVDIRSGGYGILDVAFRPGTDEAWAAVGGGTLYKSMDGGKTWRRDDAVSKVGTNIYKIKFFGKNNAFALGANGVLLKYNPDASASASK